MRGTLRLDGEAVDISHKGVGVIIGNLAPINPNETIHITIKDLDIDTDAKVVWVKAHEGYSTQTGLLFN